MLHDPHRVRNQSLEEEMGCHNTRSAKGSDSRALGSTGLPRPRTLQQALKDEED